MDYRQFMNFMEESEESGKESITVLQDYVKEFPYFQSAHSLLAKSMHEHQHVRFEKQLKLVSAYAGDRKSLFDLIHSKKGKLISDIKVSDMSPFFASVLTEPEESKKIFTDEEIDSAKPPFEEETIIDLPTFDKIENLPLVNFYNEDNETDELESDYDDPPVADPHDIIRRRLIEILGLTEEKTDDVQPEKNVLVTKTESVQTHIENFRDTDELKTENVVEVKIISTERPRTNKDSIEQLVDESARAVDFIQKAEIEYALESTLIHSLEKLPVIESQINKDKIIPVAEEKKENSFYDWLKIKTIPGFGKIEEVHAYKAETIYSPHTIAAVAEFSETAVKEYEEKKTGDITLLIDRFIQTDPKIIPSKTNFYSPANQAKKSITENEDIVSETLAKIYHRQGNLLKARSSYQKLSLFYPEKKAYFAALISELEKEINNLDKQDL